MHAVYAFLGEPAFEHDFDQIDYNVTEFDERPGTPGPHTVGGSVKAVPRASLLPPDLFSRFVNDAFWRDPEKNPGGAAGGVKPRVSRNRPQTRHPAA